ncbi:MAG: histone deacetylase [Candidatus Eremiobacteraeota bacterium]|nr:histone deacetylase [Candidatus Eremiobacteraeota bacterium]
MRIVYDELYTHHLRGIPHPERPERVQYIAASLQEAGKLEQLVTPSDALDEDVLRVHTPAYLETVKREIAALRGHAAYLSTGDTVVDYTSLDVARRAAGGALAAVDACIEHNEAVFALLRPPGHHAEPDRGMGFCVFNNAAIAARAFLARYGGRVLIVDFDYHHGNGTQRVAGNGISYVSTHAYPAYPGTGGPAENYFVGDDAVANIPLTTHDFGSEAFVALWERILPAVAARVRPNLLVVSAGFDYIAGDIVGDLNVAPAVATDLARLINRIAADHSNGRVAYVLEGGYDLNGLAESVMRISDAVDAREIAVSGAAETAIPEPQRLLLEEWA